MLVYLANIAYLLMLLAFITRDVLYLRSLLVVAQSIVVYYSWRSGVPLISVWNLVFCGINTFMVVQILRERRAVVLPADLQTLYDGHFSALTRPEFLRFWRLGHRMTVEQQRLISAGVRPDWLYFVLSGSVRVRRPRCAAVELPAGFFAGEMSLLTGEPANADVDAAAPVELIRWCRDDLHALKQRDSGFWTRIQSVIGRDIVEKIQRGEVHTAPESGRALEMPTEAAAAVAAG